MKTKKAIDIVELFTRVLGDRIEGLRVAPTIEVMQCEIIEFDEENKLLIMKLPVLKQWQNSFGTMQGGMIDAAIDNAVGSLSLLIAPPSVARSIESKFIKPIIMDLKYIYIKAKLIEQKKRRLIFDIEVIDGDSVVYATSKVVNFII